MKKFLLLAIAALMVGVAPAQTSAKKVKAVRTKSVVAKSNQPKFQISKAPMMEAKVSKRKADILLSKKFNLQAGKQLVPIYTLGNNANRRAAEIQEKYTGTGVITGRGTSPWTMRSGKLTSGEDCLIDVISNPYSSSIPNGIPVAYTKSGNTITVPATAVASFEDGSNMIIFGGTNDDGSFTMTVGDDGSLTVSEDETIFYGAFYSEVFDPTLDTYDGYIEYVENVKYFLPGQSVVPTASYESDGFFLYPALGIDWRGYSSAILPGYASVKLKSNTTDAVDAWNWTLNEAIFTGSSFAAGDVVATSNTDELEFMAEGDMMYMPASFVASYQGESSAPFTLTKGTWFAASPGYLYDDGTESACIISKANMASGSLTTLNPKGIHSLITYQGKPAAPLYFTGVNLLVDKFDATADFEMTCKIYKATRTASGKFELGELVAQSDLDKDDMLTGGNDGTARLNWNDFYVVDEFGMSSSLDYMIMEDEFAIVFEGWEKNKVNDPNGTFSGSPIASSPWGNVRQTSTYVIIIGEEEYTGYGFQNAYGNVLAGFNNSGYGYLHTTDDTNITMPVAGGKVSIHVEPMFIGEDLEGKAVTYLWLDDEEALPDWLDYSFENEVYTETEASFDLVFTAEALPEGVESREAELTFVQDLAKLTVKVTQGAATGINVVTTSVKTTGNAMYNLAGQRVDNSFKGLVIKDGKKVMMK